MTINEVPDKQLPIWPSLKLARAQQHLNDLQSAITLWAAGSPVRPEASLAEDRLKYTLKMRVSTPPPTQQWSLIVGDVIHDLRSALDALVWTIATKDGQKPRHPTQIQFPIADTEADWEKLRKKRLEGVSDVYADRISILQPYRRPEDERPRDPLTLLAFLSNRDKHRASISVGAAADEIKQDFRVSYGSTEVTDRNLPPDISFGFADLVDGAPIVELRANDPILDTKGGFEVSLGFWLDTPIGKQSLLETLSGLLQYVNMAVSVILYGYECDDPAKRGPGARPQSATAPDDDDDGWLPMDSSKRIGQPTAGTE